MARRDEKFSKDREVKDGFDKVTIAMNRVTKVVKGGRTMRQAALIVVGDKNGQVGLGMGKAAEATDAIEKATTAAKNSLIKVPMVGTTIPHQITGVFGRGKVLLMPAEAGTGVIAGGPVRAVLEMAGIQDIRTKAIGTNNPINCAKATMNGLSRLMTAEQIAALRGKTVEEILGKEEIK